jgi:mutator protein MutT
MSERFTTHLAVFILIRNKQGKVLLQRRQNTGFLDGYWDLPSGHVEANESLISAATRELREEVCVEVVESDLHLMHVHQNFLDKPYLNFTFLATQWQGEPAIGEPEKVSEIGFFAPDKLPENCSLGVRTNEKDGFSEELTYSVVTPENFEEYMHEPFDATTWGKK